MPTPSESLSEIDATGMTIGQVMQFMNSHRTPFLIRVGRSRFRVTDDNRVGIEKGLLLSMELKEHYANSHNSKSTSQIVPKCQPSLH